MVIILMELEAHGGQVRKHSLYVHVYTRSLSFVLKRNDIFFHQQVQSDQNISLGSYLI